MTTSLSRRLRSLSAIGAFVLAGTVQGSLHAESTSLNWPTYGFSYGNTRHADIDRINASNVQHLRRVWRFMLGAHERVETTPIVVNRTMYVTTGVGNSVIALDAVTGKQKWRYRPQLGAMSPCCGALNRGVAVENNRLFFATLDAQLIALDTRSGKPLWHVSIGDAKNGLSETMAPLAWNGIVFIGSSGSDAGIRGSVSAYRAANGTLLWRWYSVSPGWEGKYVQSVLGIPLHRDIAREKRNSSKYRNAWMHGGGGIWMTPALDARNGTMYVSTSNPAPVFDGAVRPGDNLYTDSIVALNARTGTMLWYYQQTPHDVWEYEPASPPILVDARGAHGNQVPAVVEAGKTRWLYVLDRRNGDLLRVSTSWSPNDDVYQKRPDAPPKDPLPLRGTIGPIAYDPAQHLALITEIDRPGPGDTWRDMIVAVDVDTGKIRWKKVLGSPHTDIRGDAVLAGALSVGRLVFVSEPYGTFYGLDASTGSTLWQYRLGDEQSVDLNENAFQKAVHRLHDWLLPLKRRLFSQDQPTQAGAGVDGNPIVYQIAGREYIALGYDAEPDRATGGAVIAAFSI